MPLPSEAGTALCQWGVHLVCFPYQKAAKAVSAPLPFHLFNLRRESEIGVEDVGKLFSSWHIGLIK
jgi:hypothetical protein